MSLPVLPDLEINRILRERIKTQKLMTQKRFADKVGVHQSTVSRVMRGDFKYGRADVRRRIIQSIMDLEWLDGQKPHPRSCNGYLIAPEVIALWPEVVHMLDSINALAKAGESELLKSVFRKLGEDGSRRLDQKEKRVTGKRPKKGGTKPRSRKHSDKLNK
jgi:transcriptional regulator with XRE-family HTH domain